VFFVEMQMLQPAVRIVEQNHCLDILGRLIEISFGILVITSLMNYV